MKNVILVHVYCCRSLRSNEVGGGGTEIRRRQIDDRVDIDTARTATRKEQRFDAASVVVDDDDDAQQCIERIAADGEQCRQCDDDDKRFNFSIRFIVSICFA